MVIHFDCLIQSLVLLFQPESVLHHVNLDLVDGSHKKLSLLCIFRIIGYIVNYEFLRI